MEAAIPPTIISDVQGRISECLTRAVKIYCDKDETQTVREVVGAYLYTLCRERLRFLKASLKYLRSRELDLLEAGRYSLPELIVHTPARWEFEHVDVFGNVSDALCCAGRYRTCSMRIPMRHKLTSPWYRAFIRRHQLKNQLGTRFRALVGHARTMTKTEFLEQFAAKAGEEIPMVDRKGRDYTLRRRIPEITPCALLNRTGYTPEQFWREVKRPNTVTPHKPQLELAL